MRGDADGLWFDSRLLQWVGMFPFLDRQSLVDDYTCTLVYVSMLYCFLGRNKLNNEGPHPVITSELMEQRLYEDVFHPWKHITGTPCCILLRSKRLHQ